jgi:hypothetical protein
MIADQAMPAVMSAAGTSSAMAGPDCPRGPAAAAGLTPIDAVRRTP